MAKVVKLPEKTPVPANWIWVELGKLSSTKSGYPFDSKRFSGDKKGKRPIIRIRDVVRGYTETYTDEDCPEVFIINKGEILIGMDGDFNLAKWNDSEALLNQRVCCIQSTSELLLNDFVYFYLPIPLKLINEATPSITVKHLSTKTISQIPFPLPPLPEQHRIVTRIESLFAKLDEAKEKAQAVVDGFELRKSAILHKAFTGELTERWRKEHGVGLDSWETKPLDEIAFLQTGLMKGKRYEGETLFLPYLRVANVQDGFLDLREIKKIEVSASSVARYSLKKGDVLFTEGGDFDKLGRGTVWEEEIPNCLHQNHIFVVRPHKSVLDSYFLSYQAGSKYGKTYFLNCSKQTTNLASINSTQLKGFPVKLPTLSEQLQIVSTINGLLNKEQQAKSAAEAVLAQIDAIKKAILVRTFRGELGTNDPEEEWAGELVKTYLPEQMG